MSRSFFHALYYLAIKGYGGIIAIFSLFNAKAALWTRGRSRWKKRHKKIAEGLSQQPIWFHAASLGEFEQGLPLMRRFKEHSPDIPLIVTFFSPSGFVAAKKNRFIDQFLYLPLDTPRQSLDFIEIWDPRCAIFIKYEFWLNTLKTLHKKNIPHFFISSKFRKDQGHFRWPLRALFQPLFKTITHFFTQDQISCDILRQNGVNNCTAVGDTRIDRVLQIAKSPGNFPLIQQFTNGKPTLILGSSWEDEESITFRAFHQIDHWPFQKLIIAPHDPNRAEQIIQRAPFPILQYSKLKEHQLSASALLIDEIGLLSKLYRYADLAFIGGGFKSGIHNTLEPAAYRIPVIFGPKHHKFKEAKELLELKAARVVSNERELSSAVRDLLQPDQQKAVQKTLKDYFSKHEGATEEIFQYIQEHLQSHKEE